MAAIPKELPECPEYFNFATDVVDKWALKSPSPQAMIWVGQNDKKPQSLDFAYFSRQSQRAAELLTRLGARSGDRMIIILPRIPAWYSDSYLLSRRVAAADVRIGGRLQRQRFVQESSFVPARHWQLLTISNIALRLLVLQSSSAIRSAWRSSAVFERSARAYASFSKLQARPFKTHCSIPSKWPRSPPMSFLSPFPRPNGPILR